MDQIVIKYTIIALIGKIFTWIITYIIARICWAENRELRSKNSKVPVSKTAGSLNNFCTAIEDLTDVVKRYKNMLSGLKAIS